MENRVGRDGEAAAWTKDATPASAKSYYLRVLKLEPGGTKRNMREMHSLATALDHLALGRPRQAADLLMQRLKALELASNSGTWEKASFLELLDAEDATLVNKEEAFMVAKETELSHRLSRRTSSVGWSQDWTSSQDVWPVGKGKSAPWGQPSAWRPKGKGQGKPDGGKDKGKGKWGKEKKGKVPA